jgi:hypothetical protein
MQFNRVNAIDGSNMPKTSDSHLKKLSGRYGTELVHLFHLA